MSSSIPTTVDEWYEKAGAHDSSGEEQEALPCYEKVYELGWRKLPADAQAGYFVGFGSTLRNCFNFKRSDEILSEGLREFPDFLALKVFLAFTKYSLGEDRAAAKLLFEVAHHAPLERYERAAKWYSENLDTHPESRP